MTNTPHDWQHPRWEDATRVHDWKNYTSYSLRDIWHTFTDEQRKVIAASLYDLASMEEWE